MTVWKHYFDFLGNLQGMACCALPQCPAMNNSINLGNICLIDSQIQLLFVLINFEMFCAPCSHKPFYVISGGAQTICLQKTCNTALLEIQYKQRHRVRFHLYYQHQGVETLIYKPLKTVTHQVVDTSNYEHIKLNTSYSEHIKLNSSLQHGV